MTLSLPPLLDAPPESDRLTGYDREHFASPRATVIGTMQSNTLLAPTLNWIETVRGRSMTHIWREQSG